MAVQTDALLRLHSSENFVHNSDTSAKLRITNMNKFIIINGLGPIIGVVGILVEIQWLFWMGVAVCILVLWLDGISGAMKFPIIPGALMIVGAIVLDPWYFGAGVGLMLWTATDTISMIVGKKFRPTSKID